MIYGFAPVQHQAEYLGIPKPAESAASNIFQQQISFNLNQIIIHNNNSSDLLQNLHMSLFVGNVSKKVTQKQFQDAFKGYGPCKVDLRKRFAFVQYDNQRNAEQAKKDLQNKNFCGLRLNIEWSKNSGRFNQNSKTQQKQNNGRKRSRSRDRSWRKGEDRWYRRSPSYEKRSSPTYSQNQDVDLDAFNPKYPRDRQLFKILIQRREKKIQQQMERKRQAEIDGQILPEGQPMQEEIQKA